jgi:hypothetical protein
MKKFLSAGFGLAVILCAPALAQLAPGGMGNGPGGTGAPSVQPQPRTPDIAPPALPGAGAPPPLATAPVLKKQASGDPTTALFAAVNSGDYSGAQDALSRGADLTAQNALGETPLDLAVALNRTSITFLLLATRNETGGDATGAPMSLGKPAKLAAAKTAGPVRLAVPVMGNDPGVPDPAAGFLGFGPKS